MTFSINDTQHKSTSAIMLSAVMLNVAFYLLMLGVILLNVVMLNVVNGSGKHTNLLRYCNNYGGSYEILKIILRVGCHIVKAIITF
jgi:hypothetical protein